MGKGNLCPSTKKTRGFINRNKCLGLLLVVLGMTVPSQAKDVTVSFRPDTVRVLRNPLNGWVMYVGRNWDENFWETEGYDVMSVGDSTVRVSDYANTCYIRTSWSSMEPEEGEYFWKNPNSRLSKLLQSALKRGMKLAFRIVVDSRDQGQNTPLYVRQAGAEGFIDPGNPKNWSPYPDDPVFQEKYAKFLKALASEFNDPDKVDFIDAYGLGKWGEAHGVKYKDYGKKEQVFDWITTLYSKTFTRIPLIINYHRLVGDTISWADAHPRSEALLESAIKKGYSLRHDAFGMTGYYQQWEKDFARKWNFKRPIIMEGGWITKAHHRYWIDPSRRYREGHSEDVRHGEYLDAMEGCVNMMDMRVNDETRSWFGKSFNLVKAFIAHGGYRLYPVSVTMPDKAKNGDVVKLASRWENIGWGYCPTNIPQWNQKYKVAYGLFKDGKLVKVIVDNNSDLSKWIKGNVADCTVTTTLDGLNKGKYDWKIALVDATKDNNPGLEIAVDTTLLDDGWLKITEMTIK